MPENISSRHLAGFVRRSLFGAALDNRREKIGDQLARFRPLREAGGFAKMCAHGLEERLARIPHLALRRFAGCVVSPMDGGS